MDGPHGGGRPGYTPDPAPAVFHQAYNRWRKDRDARAAEADSLRRHRDFLLESFRAIRDYDDPRSLRIDAVVARALDPRNAVIL